MRLLDIVPVEEYVTVHTSVCQEAMKFVVRWDGTLRGSGVTLHLSVRARCRLVCSWSETVFRRKRSFRQHTVLNRHVHISTARWVRR